MKHSLLTQVLNQAARARRMIFIWISNIHIINLMIFFLFYIVNTLIICKPEKGRMVENMLIRMAQSGQIVNKLGEDDLIGLLEQVNSQMQSQERKTTVKVN